MNREEIVEAEILEVKLVRLPPPAKAVQEQPSRAIAHRPRSSESHNSKLNRYWLMACGALICLAFGGCGVSLIFESAKPAPSAPVQLRGNYAPNCSFLCF